MFKRLLFFWCVSLLIVSTCFCQEKKSQSGNWDLTDIYRSWTDWETDVEKSLQLTSQINEFKGKLATSPETLARFLNTQDELSIILTKLYVYVIMRRDVDNRNTEINGYYQKIMTHYNKLSNELVWTDLELLEIPKKNIASWVQSNQTLSQYKHYIDKLYKQQEHILPEEKQLLINQLDKPLAGATEIYNALFRADRVYEEAFIDSNNVKISPVNMERILTYNQNQENRKKAYDIYTKFALDHKATAATIYKNILDNRSALAEIHGYSSCLESVLSKNNIPVSVYTSLIEVAQENTESLQKYHTLRKEYFGLKDYLNSDRLAVLFASDSKTYTYNEAKEIVKKAIEPLGKEYTNKIKSYLNEDWIDVYEKPGKRHGAYSINTYSVHPYILMNFGGTRKNIFTLAHELGHSAHSLYSNENQTFINHSYPIFLAEIASILNEHLLLDYLIENASSSNEKIALLVQGIQNLEGKFYINSMRAQFEYETHKMAEQDEIMNAEILADLNLDILNSYYGNTIQRADNHKYSWVAVHHYFTRYFYVYQYATSYAASLHFYDKIKNSKSSNEREKEINNYLSLLKAGGNGYPIDMLKSAGLDMTTKNPYLSVVKRMNNLVSQLENELKKIR